MSLATPDLISALAGELSDAQKTAHRANLVRELLAAGPEVRMEHFGGIDAQAAVFVVDVNGLAQIADRAAGLRLAAKELGCQGPTKSAGGR